jgi:hypothetical protein
LAVTSFLMKQKHGIIFAFLAAGSQMHAPQR